jgi:Leucine-rich repeat (LRR) protein
MTRQQSTAWLRAVAREADVTSFAQLGWNFSTNATSKFFVHDPCEERWPRVGCDATTGCIVGLNLSFLPLLHGQLPPSVFTLSSLQSLVARKSSLTAWSAAASNLPQALNLARLDLGINQLTDLPKTIYSATALTHLDLSENHITGPLSSAIGDLTRLAYLDLGDNYNTDHFDSIHGKLEWLPASLEHLDLSLCYFAQLSIHNHIADLSGPRRQRV